MNKNSLRTLSSSNILLGVIFLILAWLYISFVVTDGIPMLGWMLLGVTLLAYGIINGRLTYATPMDIPIIGLVCLLPLSLWLSVDRSLSLPKIYGLLLGLLIFYWIVNYLNNYKRLMLLIFGLLILTFGVALLGWVGMSWPASQISILEPFSDYLNSVLPAIPRQGADTGIHANTIGGALALLLPLLVGLIWDGGAFFRVFINEGPKAVLSHLAYKTILCIVFLVGLFVLLLTRSRGAFLGIAIGIYAMVVWKDRRFLWLIPVGLLGALAIFFLVADGNVTELMAIIDAGEDQTLDKRLELWRNTLLMIQDFPITGVGIGTYGAVFSDLYIVEIFPYSTVPYLQAHNSFLSVAVDLGLPALILYAALLTIFALMIHKKIHNGRSILTITLQGLACGLLAHHVFGLMDTFHLGAKLGGILWVFLGSCSAIFVHKGGFYWKQSRSSPQNSADQGENNRNLTTTLLDLLVGIGLWLLLSLVVISFVNTNVLMSVILSLVGGIILGLLVYKRFVLHISSRQS